MKERSVWVKDYIDRNVLNRKGKERKLCSDGKFSCSKSALNVESSTWRVWTTTTTSIEESNTRNKLKIIKAIECILRSKIMQASYLGQGYDTTNQSTVRSHLWAIPREATSYAKGFFIFRYWVGAILPSFINKRGNESVPCRYILTLAQQATVLCSPAELPYFFLTVCHWMLEYTSNGTLVTPFNQIPQFNPILPWTVRHQKVSNFAIIRNTSPFLSYT